MSTKNIITLGGSDVDEREALARYKACFDALGEWNVHKDNAWWKADHSVMYALENERFCEDVTSRINNYALVSALLCTIAIPPLTAEPDFAIENNTAYNAWGVSMCLSGALFTCCVLMSVFYSHVLGKMYCALDRHVMAGKLTPLQATAQVMNDLGCICLSVSMVCSGFLNFDKEYAMAFIIWPVLIVVAYILKLFLFKTATVQQWKRGRMFYNKYCGENYELLPEYESMVNSAVIKVHSMDN